MKAERFEHLEVWQHAHKVVLEVYRVTRAFPADEKFGLVSQMRRAAVSVPANIAEGFNRRGLNDKAHFYNMAQSSLEELRYYLLLCRDLGFPIDFPPLSAEAERTGRMLNGLIASLRR